MSSYTTITGDTWDMVSLRVYGSEQYIKTLIEANATHIKTAVFTGGIVLNVPDLTTAQKVSSNTPPWKL